MSRYGDNIRRIAQTDDLNSRVRQAEQRLDVLDKAMIPGARAIAYPTGGTEKGSPGATNADKEGSPDEKTPDEKDATDEAGKDGKSTSGSDIINGDTTLQPGEDPGKIELEDCETGEPIDIIMNAGANEGESKFQHPEGWTILGASGNASGYENWELGKYWSGSSSYFPGGTADGPTPDVGARAGLGYYNGTFDYEITDIRNIQVSYNSQTSADVSVEYYLTWNSLPINSGWVTDNQTWGRQNCGSETGTSRCITSIPLAYNNWQEQDPDYHHQLAFSSQDGGFVSSSKDDGLPAKFRNDVGSGKGLNNLRLCTDDGNEVVMSALIDGSFAFFEEDGFGDPEPDAKIYHFDKKGKYENIITEKEYTNLKSTNNPGA